MSRARIDKILSHEGFGSRKAIRKLLRTCEVLVNGKKISDSGEIVDPDKDEISVDGEVLSIKKNYYLMMNKKPGCVSANKDGLHQTVFDFLDEKYRTGFLAENLHLVGRLDIDTEGLLLFTTDGALTHRMTSPKTHSPKSYFVRLANKEDEKSRNEICAKFKAGIHIPSEDNDGEADCKSAKLEWCCGDGKILSEDDGINECVLTITEGKYHQVKRMFRAVGNEVVYLKRLTIGSLKLDEKLGLGEYRELTEEEIDGLLEDGEE